jgi:hypothetical protein
MNRLFLPTVNNLQICFGSLLNQFKNELIHTIFVKVKKWIKYEMGYSCYRKEKIKMLLKNLLVANTYRAFI